ncbi:MAG: iron-sulfur cluster assembly scaffold protein [Gammaproteobacteria bacterium WSBS_2016_MAG_OTU1]
MNESFYQQQILTLAKKRRDDKAICGDDVVHIQRDNPLCGDSVRLSATGDAHTIHRFKQQVRGCILCEAATQCMLALIAQQNDYKYLAHLFAQAETMFIEGKTNKYLQIFAPVIAHPARHECVLLPFRALNDIIKKL